MQENLISKTSITIDAPIAKVWDALVNPAMTKKYLFGAEVASDWKVGSPITFKGEYQGKTYEDKGIILEVKPERLLRYTHWSNLSGLPDIPENYHGLTWDLSSEGNRTKLSLAQDNNATEKAREHSDQFWTGVLATIKQLAESP